MPHHTFTLVYCEKIELFYRTAGRNKGKNRGAGKSRAPKRPTRCFVDAGNATHYPNRNYAQQAITGMFAAKGSSYKQLSKLLGRTPRKSDLQIESFRAFKDQE